jgi:predicted nucleotidyltransferase
MENIKQITQYLKSSVDGLDIIYQFGSQVAGPLHKDSDLDIAIKCKSAINIKDIWALSSELADLANCHVDLIDLSVASTVMRLQVVDKGICLYESDKKKTTTFEDFVYSDYVRLNEEREGILKDIATRGTVYG